MILYCITMKPMHTKQFYDIYGENEYEMKLSTIYSFASFHSLLQRVANTLIASKAFRFLFPLRALAL